MPVNINLKQVKLKSSLITKKITPLKSLSNSNPKNKSTSGFFLL